MTLLSFFSMAIGWVVVRAAQFRGLCPVRSPPALVGQGLWHTLMGLTENRSNLRFGHSQPHSAPFGLSDVVRRELNNWLFYYFYMVVSLWVLVKWWLGYEWNTLLSLIGRRLSRITNLVLGGSTEEKYFLCVHKLMQTPVSQIFIPSGKVCIWFTMMF